MKKFFLIMTVLGLGLFSIIANKIIIIITNPAITLSFVIFIVLIYSTIYKYNI